VAIPADARADSVTVTLPSGRKLQNVSTLDETGEQGIYTVVYAYADGTAREARFALHMDAAESDVRAVAPDDRADAEQTRSDQGRELTAILLAAFLILLLIEMGVSRYVG
jgi:hypothetical protein